MSEEGSGDGVKKVFVCVSLVQTSGSRVSVRIKCRLLSLLVFALLASLTDADADADVDGIDWESVFVVAIH